MRVVIEGRNDGSPFDLPFVRQIIAHKTVIILIMEDYTSIKIDKLELLKNFQTMEVRP